MLFIDNNQVILLYFVAMFRHQGKSRTFKHNLQIASVLSFVAGMVNVAGFLSFHELTTNVTGHFALFINDLANMNFWKGTVYFIYILSFLLGAFTSAILIETFKGNKKLNVFVLPVFLEAILLILIPILLHVDITLSKDVFACILLFAMGLQNSLVTKISNAVVRTTHLTGLFTDLGIELSQLFFPKSSSERVILKSTIKLRIIVIAYFFLGGLIGGYFYAESGWKMNILYVSALILIGSLFYDDIRYKLIVSRRKFKQRKRA